MQSGFDPPPPPQNPPPPGYPPPPPGGQGGGGGYPPPPQNPYAPYAQYPQMAPAPGYMPGHGYGYGYVQPTEGKAVTSLVLGLVSLFCFGPLTGIPAIILGVMSKREIDRSGGALGGQGFAIGGIVTGALSTLLSLFWIGAMIVGMVGAAHAAKSIPTAPYPTYPTTFGIPTATPTTTAPTAGGAVASTTMHGAVKVISLGSGRPLQDQLIDLRTSEIADGRLPIVETTASWCTACKEIESTLDDPLLQRALPNVTFVKVDVDEFGSELASLKMETNAIPFFYKIDSTAKATDAISGDEWDDNTAANEAPILGPFTKGTLKKRRHPSPVGTSL